MTILRVDQISKSLGGVDIVRGLSLVAGQGEFISVVGPSGCGKTTLLTCLAGLRRVDSGAVLFEGKELSEPPEGMSLIFQDYSRSLLPWRRNLENVVFGMRRLPDAKQDKREAKKLKKNGEKTDEQGANKAKSSKRGRKNRVSTT